MACEPWLGNCPEEELENSTWWDQNSNELFDVADKVACILFPKTCTPQPAPVVVQAQQRDNTAFWILGLLLVLVLLVLLFKK